MKANIYRTLPITCGGEGHSGVGTAFFIVHVSSSSFFLLCFLFAFRFTCSVERIFSKAALASDILFFIRMICLEKNKLTKIRIVNE